MSSMLATSSLAQDPLAPPRQVGAKPFLANAGIGNRPTLLTVSLVYDESGDASAFHVALIPRNADEGQRSSTEYDAEAPGVMVQKAAAGWEVEPGAAGAGTGGSGEEVAAERDEQEEEPPAAAAAAAAARKRSPGRTWDTGGQAKSQKRRAAQA